MIQESTTPPKTFQFTTFGPPATIPNPRILPIIECVDETGRAVKVAINTHRAADIRDANIPSINIFGSLINPGFIIPLLIVAVTWEPKKYCTNKI